MSSQRKWLLMSSAIVNLVAVSLSWAQPIPQLGKVGPTAVDELLHMRSPAPDWQAHIQAHIDRGEKLPTWDPRTIEPADDAPLAELLTFWKAPPLDRLEEVDDDLLPSTQVARRLVIAIASDPSLARELPWSLPLEEEFSADVMRAYKALLGIDPKTKKDEETISRFHNWLMLHTDHLREDLIKAARLAVPADASSFLGGSSETRALDRLVEVDWPRAEKILRGFAEHDNPSFQIYAIGRLIAHGAPAELLASWRAKLKKFVSDKKLDWAVRRDAAEQLLEGKADADRKRAIDRLTAIDEKLGNYFKEPESDTEEEVDPASIDAFAKHLREGELNFDWVWRAIVDREQYKERAREMEGLEGERLGLQLTIARDENRAAAVLRGDDADAQSMLLVAARQVRLRLPTSLVISLLDSKDALVAHAAEHFLECDDSPAARKELLRQNPENALITGSWIDFDPGFSTFRGYRMREDESRQKVLSGEADEVIALLSSGHWGDDGDGVIEIKDGKGMLYHRENEIVRYRERALDDAELASLKNYLRDYSFGELPPYNTGSYDGIQYDFFQVTKAGGRRVFMNNPAERSPQRPSSFGPRPKSIPPDDIYGILVEKFVDLERAKPMMVRYQGLDLLPGFRVLSKREDSEIFAISGEDGALKVQKRDGSRYSSSTTWHLWKDGKLSAAKTAPPPNVAEFRMMMNRWHSQSDQQWQGRIGEGHLRFRNLDYDPFDEAERPEGVAEDAIGLWLFREGKKPELFKAGSFLNPVASADGKWIAARSGDESIVRINVETREVSDPIGGKVLAYLESPGRFLIRQEITEIGDHPDELRVVDVVYRFLDPETGELEIPMGEFGPLDNTGWRPWQPTGQKNEIWSTIGGVDDAEVWYTSVGRYNLTSFKFEEVKRIPRIWFDADDMWVDEANRVIYLALYGDLLQLPL